MKRLDGRIALVTGGSRGIGRAIARRLGELGATVTIGYLGDDARANAALAEIRDAGAPAAQAVRADVSRPDGALALVRTAVEAYGRLDILVNNAGIQRSSLVHKTSDDDWRRVLDTNLSSVFYLSRAVLPGMLAAGSGDIINIASASSYVAQRGAAAYAASKHGLIGLTKVLALETAGRGVLVNAVAPGLTDTDLVRELSDEQRQGLLKLVPLQRVAAADEIAALVAFILTAARYSTGNVFHASGGVTMG